MFCAKKGSAEFHHFSQCKYTLRKHVLRVDSQAYIWWSSFVCFLVSPDHKNCGLKQNNDFLIVWMEGAPALEEVLEFFSCGCREEQSASDYAYIIDDLNTLE